MQPIIKQFKQQFAIICCGIGLLKQVFNLFHMRFQCMHNNYPLYLHIDGGVSGGTLQ